MPQKKQVARDISNKIDNVLNQVRSFNYDQKLIQEADELVRWASKQEKAPNRSTYRALSLVIEIYNEYGLSHKSKSVIQEFKPLIEKPFKETNPDTFKNLSEAGVREHKKFLEQVCWVYAGAAITYYWYHENLEGQEYIQEARTVIDQYITTEHNGVALACHGIKSRLSYYSALFNLQIQDLKNASNDLVEALNSAYERYSEIEYKYRDNNKYWESPEGIREAKYTTICVAKIQGYGTSIIHQLRGELKQAEFLLRSAELVLRQAHSPTMAEMIRFRLFKVRRALAGRDASMLDPIIEGLKKCYEAFSMQMENDGGTQQNQFYASLSAFEISLSNIYKAQGFRHEWEKKSKSRGITEGLREEYPEYSKTLGDARAFAEKISDETSSDHSRFLKELLLSRIEKEGGYEKAKKYAEQACEKAKEHAEQACDIAKAMRRPDLEVDAYIAIGEALLKLGRSPEALEKFEYADNKNREENNNLDRIRAVCYLRKAEAYVALNRKHDALRMLEEWKLLSNQIEFKVVHYIATKVEAQIEEFLGDFVIDKETDNLKLDYHIERLREWLITLVLRRHRKEEEKKPNFNWKPDPLWLENDMGISKSTSYKWLEERAGDSWKRKKKSP